MKRTERLYLHRNDERLLQRFESKLEKHESGCWFMNTQHDKDGYPLIWFHDNNIRCSQVSVTLYKKENCTNKVVNHTCHNQGCVNPEHLFLADNRTNTRAMLAAKRGGHQKISEADVRAIYKGNLQGISNKQIAQQYGISASTVCNILKGRNWEWLYGEYLEMKSKYKKV